MTARDAKKAVRDEARKHLLEELREGDSVFIIVRKHSRTGYSKSISIRSFAIRTDAGYHATRDRPKLQPLTLTFWIGKLMGYAVDQSEGTDVLRTDDYPQEFVAHLSQALFGIDKANALFCEVL
jgi:hypothetical protein